MELILIPVIAGLLAAWSGKYAKWVSLAGSVASLALLVFLFKGFKPDAGFQFTFNKAWFFPGMHFHTGIDGISMVLLLLTNILCPVILLSAFGKEKNAAVLFALITGMQGALNGVFLSLDGLMFYIFWELALIPIYFITVLWGEGNNIFRTTLRFFIYTFIGSLAMLASLIYLAGKSPDGWNFGYDALVSAKLSLKEALWVGSGILLAFAVKIPLMPFHSWQPDTYTEAPASGSMLLSGIMLKMGLYGLIRWFFPLVPEALHIFNPFILYAGVVGVLYGALIAIRQNDMKRIIAFSSLSHVGLIAAGMATLSSTGLKGSMVQLFSHGVNVIGLFIAVDIIQKRFSTRDLQSLGGIAKLTPAFSVLFLVLVLASTAVPFSNGFPGELLLLKAVFTKNITLGILSGLTIILCAVYMLRMYQFSMFGQAGSGVNTFENLKWYEFSSLAILAVLVLFFGLHPQTLIDISGPSIEKTIELLSNTMGVVK